MSELSEPSLEGLAERIEQSMLSDRDPLRRALRDVSRRRDERQPYDRGLVRLLGDLERSEQRRSLREQSLPRIEFDQTLPIHARRDDIVATIQQHQVCVICGETGSGKSTQLPLLCLDAGRGLLGMIGHTQPRRIAARSVAARVAEEMGSRLGEAASFKIRFTDTTSPRTFVKLMTDGILLAETRSDRLLSQYDTIIIDEAHERSLNIDFLLGYLKRLLPERPDLRLIITSATIDAERFAQFFGSKAGPAPVLEVSGRTYPVELRYRPPAVEDDEDEVDLQRAAADACEELAFEGPGDMLVFMPTERDIRETAKILQGRAFPGEKVEIVPLFGRLSEKEQNRVFQPHSGRRIVIATNVAESSLTVPGIRYVIDPGTARLSRFSSTSQVQRLPIEAISQASANQRAGRCGRIGPGICVRLYSAEDYASRDPYTPPEILRTNLASVLLQMKSLDLGRVEEFPFLDPPPPSAVRSGLKSLYELNALDGSERLTAIGKAMARLPADPRISRMVLGAADEQSLEEVLIIAAALELRDPRDRPIDKQQAADTAHAKFRHEQSDFLSLLKLWDFYAGLEEKLSHNQLRKACLQNFLSFNRMREWKDLHRQLRDIVLDQGIKPTPRRNDEQAIHRAILSGLLSNIAMRGEAHEYSGAGGQKLFLWPGSVTFASKPKWIMAAELVETTRRFARMTAPIQPGWVEPLALHLVKRTYSEPHWNSRAAAVMAWEKVLLFGMPIVPKRECRYGPIDPKASRELFIQHALVEGDFQTKGEFFQHNRQLKEELADWQAKVRQGGQFLGEQAEYDFYDERIPADVFDGARFETWRRQAEARTPKLLFLSRSDLFAEADTPPRAAAFPNELKIGTMKLPLEYHLEPGASDDGVTLVTPPEGLNQLSDEALSWLVPGLLEEKIAALIKTLPKDLRILFIPAPETAKELVQTLTYGKGELLGELASALRRRSGEHIPVTAFDPERLPEHLKFNVRVVDDRGKVLAEGRKVGVLRDALQSRTEQSIRQVDDDRWRRDGLTSWNFGTLPAQVELQRGGVTVVAFPMLKEAGESVSLRLATSPAEAERETRQALVRLFLIAEAKRISDQVKHFPKVDTLRVQAMALPGGKEFSRQLSWRIAEQALFRSGGLPRSEADWNTRLKQARNQISVAVQDLTVLMEPLLAAANDVRRLLDRKHPPAIASLVGDLRAQYQSLIAPDFLVATPFPWLQQFPRYLQAMMVRFQKATTGGFQKDARHLQTIMPHQQRLTGAMAQMKSGLSAPLTEYRFLLEEYRVSLFAQQLRTAVPVSEKRLNEVWQSIR